MSDDLPETPPALPFYCSACFTDLDPRGFIETPCYAHQPEIPRGLDDERMGPAAGLYGGAECGDGNAAWCDFIHRKRHLLRGPA